MQEQGSPFTDQSSSILVASGPQDERAIALVQVLREAGLHVIFAETVTLAARLSREAAACVVVLRPDTWKMQTISVVMRAKPACLIPVLAEPMNLPRGPWTKPALALATEGEQGEQELIQTLRDYIATRPAPTRAQRKKSALVPLDAIRILPLRPKRRRRRNVRALITTILLILFILGLGGLVGYRYYTHLPATQLTANSVLSTLSSNAYNATAPGPCDTGGGQWREGDHYIKTVDKKKVEILDKYTTLQCQPDGALVTRSGDYDNAYSELFFEGPLGQTSLASHYQVQVSATIQSGDTQTSLTMDVHIRNYARYSFNVDATGHWEANINSAVDGTSINRLATGFLSAPSKRYTLTVEVYGPTMILWINGTRITSVTDATYTDNSSVAFGVTDYGASKPVSALFSNFQSRCYLTR